MVAVREKTALKNDGVVLAASPKQDITYLMERVGVGLSYQKRDNLPLWLPVLLSLDPNASGE